MFKAIIIGGTGATGATGPSGSIAVPSADSNLAVTAVAAVDTNLVLGYVARTFTVSGMDNVTPESRLRYHVYLGTSATTKSFKGETTGTTNLTTVNPIDSRNGGAIPTTITLATTSTLGDTFGSVSHLLVCPGNEAGDAASCVSAALNDRGSGGEVSGISGDNAASWSCRRCLGSPAKHKVSESCEMGSIFVFQHELSY